MNYIETKISFKKKYSDIEIDDILNNFLIKDYTKINYKEYLKELKYISKQEITNMCLEFFQEKEETLYPEINKILKNIDFLNEGNKEITDNGKTFYDNGIINCKIFLKNNLYDLFILVHEITHCLMMLHSKKEEYKDEYLLFSEVLPFKIEDELVSYLSNNEILKEDLNKCIKSREIVLKNIVKNIYDSKDNLIEDIEFDFRYIMAILYKNKIKIPIDKAIKNIGIINIKEIIDFSI